MWRWMRVSEYIDRGVAIARITALEVTNKLATLADAKRRLADMPAADVAPVVHWISATEQLPESNHKNDHVGDVLCFVPPRDGCYQSGLYLGKPKHVAADDGSGNFWGRPMQASDWTLWGWIYLEKPVVTHWMPLPEPPKMDGGADDGKTDV